MKYAILFLAALAFCSSAFAAEPVIGQPAPAFTGTDSNGKAVSLSDFKGKVVVLEWTNNECPFVKKHYESGNMQSLQKKAAENGVAWLSIISSAPGKQGHVDGAKANALTVERGAAPAAVLLDETGAIGKLYDAKTTPHMFVIDDKGVLVYAGAIDDTPSTDKDDIAKAVNHVQLALDDLKTGRPVMTSWTKSYGCAIKYAE
jgi:peroxiredoxin